MKPILPSRGTFRGIINYYSNKGKLQNVYINASVSGSKNLIKDQNLGNHRHWSSEANNAFGQWFSVNIDNKRILYSAYSIFTSTGANCYPRSWDVYISNDQENWTKVDERRNEDSLNKTQKNICISASNIRQIHQSCQQRKKQMPN